MKKLTRKLLLSVFSLGLAVVTLSTTTFAWYTANASVTATGLSANTQADVSGSLEISKTGETWGPTVNFNTTYENIIPLQLIGNELKTLDGTGTGNYIQFTFFVRTSTNLGKATPVYLQNFEIENTTTIKVDGADVAGLPTKNQLVENGIAGMAGQLGSQYTVDAVRALSLTIANGHNVIGTQEYSYGEAYTTPKSDSVTTTPAMDALAYYDAVMTNDITTEDQSTNKNLTTASPKGIEVANIVSTTTSGDPSTPVEVTITIWLDGWDQYCFDACQGQTFAFKFSLTTEEGQIKIGTTA